MLNEIQRLASHYQWKDCINPAKVLITGVAGYIGSILAEILHVHGHDVIGIDNLMYNQGPLVHPVLQNIDFYKYDAREIPLNLIQAADIIIPLAALVGAPLCDKYPREAREINRDAIKILCEQMSPHQLLVFPNTNSGYGSTTEICTEETPLNAISLYGQLKDETEKIVMQRENSTVFRLATVFGTSYRTRLDLLVNTLVYEGFFTRGIEVFDEGFNRNYVHVEDVVTMFCIAHQYPEFKGQIFNVGNDALNMTKGELVKRISKHLGNVDIYSVNKTDPDKRNYIVSSKKLNDTGFYCNVSLEYGIDQLVEFYKLFPRNHTHLLEILKNI